MFKRQVSQPLSPKDFQDLFDDRGQLLDPEKFYLSVSKGGVDTEIRRNAWRLLFGYFESGLTNGERFEASQMYQETYEQLKRGWISELIGNYELIQTIHEHSSCGPDLFISKEVLEAKPEEKPDAKHSTTIKLKHFQTIIKDVPRTYLYGRGNINQPSKLFNILMSFIYQRPNTGYIQGMSDVVSVFLHVLNDECECFRCFDFFVKEIGGMYTEESLLKKLAGIRSILRTIDKNLLDRLSANHLGDMSVFYPFLMPFFLREFPSRDELSIRFFEMVCARILYDAKFSNLIDVGKGDFLTYDLFVCVAIFLLRNKKRNSMGSSRNYDDNSAHDDLSYIMSDNAKTADIATLLKMTNRIIKKVQEAQVKRLNV